jgi:hypothetical protein
VRAIADKGEGMPDEITLNGVLPPRESRELSVKEEKLLDRWVVDTHYTILTILSVLYSLYSVYCTRYTALHCTRYTVLTILYSLYPLSVPVVRGRQLCG